MSEHEENTQRSVIRLSLTVPALERLLGGDTELETRLRLQVAQQFTKDHIAPLMKCDAVQEVLKQIELHAQEQLQKQIGQVGGFANSITLTNSFKEKLDYAIKKALEGIIDRLNPAEEIEKRQKERLAYWENYINRKTHEALDANIELRIREGIQGRLEAAAG